MMSVKNKIGEKMKGDEELEMLLDEIPHVVSLNLNHPHSNNGHNVHGGQEEHGSIVKQTMEGLIYGVSDDDQSGNYNKHTNCASPVSGFSLQSDGSSSSLFSGENGSPPPLEDLKSHIPSRNSHYPNELLLNSGMPDLHSRKKANESLIDELNLSRSLGRMSVSDEQEDFSVDPNGIWLLDRSSGDFDRINSERFVGYGNYMRGHSDYWAFQSSVMRPALSELQHEHGTHSPLGLRYCNRQTDGLDRSSSPLSSPYQKLKSYLVSSMNRPSVSDALLYAQRNGMNFNEERGVLPDIPRLSHPRPHLNVQNGLHYDPRMVNGKTRESSSIRNPKYGLESFEDSLIIQEEGLNYAINKRLESLRGNNNKGSLDEISVGRFQQRRLQPDHCAQFSGIFENGRSVSTSCPFSVPSNFNSVVEARGCIYLMAKDQNGCRSLQRAFDEGKPMLVQMIFNEIIDHVVELMMNPFGNYLMQKLLEVCNEEQRIHIVLMVTKETGDLIRISLNTHGTRVIQKLIDTLKTRQQISLVVSALEPGFLALIKDLNGNHVIQRCLQCLSNEDNEFIFVAAAKYCVDIATHQHGCCVLQRCITRSSGAHRENLIAEISGNGLLLAQDAFGNYVIQFILDLKIPSVTSGLNFQFEGNYVHLSTQKFSSHVVEKCLMVGDEHFQSTIIHEILAACHFEQLLQDPHGNYVIQTALRYTEGPLHNLLVDAIESHKAISRNSPYSKRIFSQKLLKK